MRLIDLTGQTFGRLTVLGRSQRRTKWQIHWDCVCECGNTCDVGGKSLRTGDVRSCGCLRKESIAAIGRRAATHGKTGTGAYESWAAMKYRCSNSNHMHFDNYGGRGIKVCERWQAFENFYEDMGDRPAGMTLDRYPDVDGNYEPGNCRWATDVEQGNNKRTSRLITHGGETKTLTQWARSLGMRPGTLKERIRKGWSIEKAITEPLGERTKLTVAQVLEIRASKETHAYWARKFNMKPESIAYARNVGWKSLRAVGEEN